MVVLPNSMMLYRLMNTVKVTAVADHFLTAESNRQRYGLHTMASMRIAWRNLSDPETAQQRYIAT
jgi:hypothetical protein